MYVPLEFQTIDLIAFIFFCAIWMGFETLPFRTRWKTRSITYHIEKHRQEWMKNIMRRELQPVDGILQTTLQQSIGFFASTSILAIGGLFAALGAADKAIAMLGDFPLTVPTTQAQWEFKVMLLILTFVFAFFKFVWSIRLFSYVAILIGAAPVYSDDEKLKEEYAERLGRLHSLGARHFTTGLNAYLFALVATTWFVSPWAFLCATVWLTLVLLRRTFNSNFAKILAGKK